MLNITPPPALQGDEQAQLTQVYRYLFRLSEQLNAASIALDSQADKASLAVAKAAGIDPATTANLGGQYTSLVSLIVKTAHIVQTQMDKIETRLDYKYTAESEWGELTEEVRREIAETAKYTIENYQYGAEVLNIPEMAADFEAYKIETEGFIKRGIIGYDDDGYPILGIAIGQELKSRKVTVDGAVFEEFDTTKNMATYTADKLSFWVDGVEVAYLSNSELVVTRIIVSDSIQLGDWNIAVNAKDGMAIQKRIGSELDLSENDTITVTADKINAVADQIDLSGNTSIKLTADQVNAVADKIDLSANESINIIANQAAKTFRQEDMPMHGVNPGDVWCVSSTGKTYRAEDASRYGLRFYLTADGEIGYDIASNSEGVTIGMQGYDLVLDGIVLQLDEKCEFVTPIRWVEALSDEGLQRYVRVDGNALCVGAQTDEVTTGEVRIDHNSVDIVTDGTVFSSFTSNSVEFGNYEIRRTADGGIAFKMR